MRERPKRKIILLSELGIQLYLFLFSGPGVRSLWKMSQRSPSDSSSLHQWYGSVQRREVRRYQLLGGELDPDEENNSSSGLGIRIWVGYG